jgi:hypothetical protein
MYLTASLLEVKVTLQALQESMVNYVTLSVTADTKDPMPYATQQPTTTSDAKKDTKHPVVAFPHSSTQERPLHNLPLELSSFVGREQEGAEVKRLLVEDKNRIRRLRQNAACPCGSI